MNFGFFNVITEEIKYLQGFWKETGKYLYLSDGKWSAGSLGANGGLEQCQTAIFRAVDGWSTSWSNSCPNCIHEFLEK